MKHLFLFFLLLPVLCFSQTLSGVPTFNCVSLYGKSLSSGQVQYKESTSSTWLNGYDLWQDSRSIGGRSAGEWRGSVVNLKSGTSYDFKAGGATLTVTTWSESFPVVSTTTISSPTTISTSGTPTGYKVYTGSINGGTNNIVVTASYIIIRGMTLTGAGEDAILIGAGAHDVIIENCDISGWGFVGMGSNNQAGVRCKAVSPAPYRMIVQRNKIHDSRDPGQGWDAGGRHPTGPNGINWETPGDNNIIRYNSFYSSGNKKMMDICGGSDNFSTQGFPGANSDIYGNFAENGYDDGFEIEGGGQNVRVWGNWVNNTFTGISSATCSIGPLYIFNNITNVGQRLHDASFTPTPSQNDNEDRGPFNKTGSQDASFRGGRVFLFHNTVLEPIQSGFKFPRGLEGGIIDAGGPVTNVVSRNNIWQTANSNQGGKPINLFQGSGSGTNCDFDYDLMNQSASVGSGKLGTHSITGTPSYTSSVPLTLDTSGYYLAPGSKGLGVGIALNNFNDGVNVDMGAYQTGEAKFQYGVNAYTGAVIPPPPANQFPSATVSANPSTITLPTNSVMLTGTGSDPDGNIIAYSWSKLSGPSQFTFSTPNAATTTVSNLAQGSYVFQLTVTDNAGATASASTTIVVNAAPPPPVTKFISYTITTIKAVYSDSTTVTQIIKTQ